MLPDAGGDEVFVTASSAALLLLLIVLRTAVAPNRRAPSLRMTSQGGV